MKKVYLLLLIFFVFSCKNTPNKDKAANDPGLSQLDLTKEKDQAGANAGFSDEPSADAFIDSSADNLSVDGPMPADEDALAQNGISDGPVLAENPETKTDDLKADALNNEQKTAAKAVEEKKDTTEEKKLSANEVKPPAPIAAVQPPPAPVTAPVQPPAAAKEEPPAAEKPADEKQEAKSDAASGTVSDSGEPPPPPRYQPWITPPPTVSAVKDDAPVPNKQALIQPKEENVFSRTVHATVGQLVDIPFRGNNWSYLEDMVSRRGIAYMSRRVDSEGMIFTFRAEDTGIFALRFYRRDYIRDFILYDYVQVIVEEPPDKGSAAAVNPSIDRGKVTAEPRWPSALEEAEMLRGGARPSSAAEAASGNKNGSASSPPAASSNRDSAVSQIQGTTPQTSSANRDSTAAPAQGTTAPPQTASNNRDTPSQTQGTGAAPQPVTPSAPPQTMPADTAPPAEKKEKLPPEEILKKAQDAFNGGNTADAIALLDQYTEFYPGGNDELYWLYGQFYEANTPSRNILLSLDYYRRLVNEYPQSRRYNDARRRISYLERFYINIQ